MSRLTERAHVCINIYGETELSKKTGGEGDLAAASICYLSLTLLLNERCCEVERERESVYVPCCHCFSCYALQASNKMTPTAKKTGGKERNMIRCCKGQPVVCWQTRPPEAAAADMRHCCCHSLWRQQTGCGNSAHHVFKRKTKAKNEASWQGRLFFFLSDKQTMPGRVKKGERNKPAESRLGGGDVQWASWCWSRRLRHWR